MSLSSLQLEAFAAVARTLSFSRAAAQLHLTQSALSQRIANLEEELGLTLFLRQPRVALTASGERLFALCRTREGLEAEYLAEVRGAAKGELAGVVRLAGYSSILRSAILPALAPLLVEHPKVSFELMSREMAELPLLLQRGEADLVVMDHRAQRDGFVALSLGTEEYVVIESAKGKSRADTFLDHDPDDTATHLFFEGQPKPPPRYQRAFLDDVYGVLDGVVHGLGRAVMSRHLVRKGIPVRIAKGYVPRRVPVVLHYAAQPYYTRLHEAVVQALVDGVPGYL